MSEEKEKVFIAGNSNNKWTQLFVEHVLLKQNYSIYIQRELSKDGIYNNYYMSNNIFYYADYTVNDLCGSIPILKSIIINHAKVDAVNNKTHFNKIFVLYASPTHIKCALNAESTDSEIFVLFLGSDMFRVKKRHRKILYRFLNKKNVHVVCVSENLAKLYSEQYKNPEHEAPWIIDFGNSQIPVIDSIIKMGFDNAKKRIGINPNKITITIGYNANPQQQHEKVLRIIDSLPEDTKNRISIILPMTYHGTNEYISFIKNSLDRMDIEHIVLTDYMNSEEMASLWVASDVFIHAQTTDALSASLLEAIYAGCTVLNGAWLHYPELDKWGIMVDEFPDFSHLREKLIKAASGDVMRKRDYKEILFKHASWETCELKWQRLLCYR